MLAELLTVHIIWRMERVDSVHVRVIARRGCVSRYTGDGDVLQPMHHLLLLLVGLPHCLLMLYLPTSRSRRIRPPNHEWFILHQLDAPVDPRNSSLCLLVRGESNKGAGHTRARSTAHDKDVRYCTVWFKDLRVMCVFFLSFVSSRCLRSLGGARAGRGHPWRVMGFRGGVVLWLLAAGGDRFRQSVCVELALPV